MPRVGPRKLDEGAASAAAPVEEKAIRRARKRFARRQWARRWLAWRRVLVAVLVTGAVAGSGWLVLFSSALAISDVSVTGNEVLEPAEVRRAASVPIGEPVSTVNLAAITGRVEALAPVLSADVSRAWPDGVRIVIHEREALAVLERDGIIRGVDEQGVLFRSYPSTPKDMPVFEMGTETDADALAEAAAVVDVLPAGLAAKVVSVRVETIDAISLALDDGRTVFWGSADDSANKAKVVAVLLEQKASTYDVSVPGQPTIRG